MKTALNSGAASGMEEATGQRLAAHGWSITASRPAIDRVRRPAH
jgi:NAD(P)-dependent dehydrogenase (short-subunit alcohol dehydrogenase family)